MRFRRSRSLDHLSMQQFRSEVTTALGCIAEATDDQSEQLAASYGL
jgi:hypothetical protein